MILLPSVNDNGKRLFFLVEACRNKTGSEYSFEIIFQNMHISNNVL